MIETNLVHKDLIDNEPLLEDHLHDNQVDYQEAISTSYKLMIQDIKNQNLDLRKLCKKLWLQETSKTVTATTYNGTESKEDRVERLRWVVNVTSLTGNAIFALQGRNSTSDSWSTVSTEQVNEIGNHKFLMLEVRANTELEIYKFYRIQKTDSTSTVIFKSYLVETTYENLHLWRALSLVCETLVLTGADIFTAKAEKYERMYQNYLVENKYYYDSDDDEEIGIEESEADYRQVTISRG